MRSPLQSAPCGSNVGWRARRCRLRAVVAVFVPACLLLSLFGEKAALARDPALDSFVSEVRQRNPGLKARGLASESVRREASAAGLLPDPELSIMFDRFPERMGGEMPMVRYQVSQMLPWPGKLGLMEEAVERRADGSASLARAREVELVRDAKRAYFML